MSEVVIIGAGPYGLSLGAQLRAHGVGLRIFGRVMANWRHKVPHGMLLKSDGFASNLENPDSALTLRDFSRQQGLAYASVRVA